MAQVSVDPAGPAEPGGQAGQSTAPPDRPRGPAEGHGLIERVMSTVIRRLAWSRLSEPRVAVTLAGCGLLLGILVGALAPNTETLSKIRLPLSNVLPPLGYHLGPDILATVMLYSGDVLTCLGLAGMLWAHSQGWRPNPRHLCYAATVVVAIMVCLTPVGSSDTASYAAYGRIAALGANPYLTHPGHFFSHQSTYYLIIGSVWKGQPSVYGPIATWIQTFAGVIGGASTATTVWVLMVLNGLAFLGVGWLLLKTSDDPIRATLFWTANPVLIQQLVGGGHLDTFVAAAAICAIQVARRFTGLWGDVLVGVLIGVGCGIKISAVLIGLGLAWPLLRRREWMRTARIAAVSLATIAVQYSYYGTHWFEAIKPIFAGSKWAILPSPWWFLKGIGELTGQTSTMVTLITVLWPIAMVVVAWLIYQRISSDQPSEVVAPFALTFAWVVVAPWVFPWYTALAWVALTQVPRNRMTRWITIVTVLLAIWHSSGGQATTGQV